MAGGAEVAALAGEGEQAFVAAVGALETCEASSEVAAAEKGLDGGYGAVTERAEGLAVVLLVVCEEGIPAMVDNLPEGRSAGAAGLVDEWHRYCSYEQYLCGSSWGRKLRLS